jgi:hypothetical protein
MEFTSHSPSPEAKGCTNNVDGGNGDLTTQLHLWQKKTMKKNGNWDNASLKLAMGSIETTLKQGAIYKLLFKGGVCLSHHFTTMCMGLHNHEKEGKQMCCKKKKKLN